MIIHTLGPEETDSSSAAYHYLKKRQTAGQIVLHDCFEDITHHLTDYRSDFLIMPAAYKSFRDHIDWADFHYSHLRGLRLVACFRHPLNPLVLVRRNGASNGIACTHPATTTLLRHYLGDTASDCEIRYADSKYLAYQMYRREKARYVITSLRIVRLDPDESIEQTWTPDMVWCVYEIL
ncbi:hypothetical protein ABNN70_02585 [Sporolactobacillus sp. Y61]|uniref:Amino acid biosynthesis protein n=1 Tax=Sporolactobacillus sp. Y61 TaxID=3160863 RepID=A0AAU8IHE1_9BACL